MSFQRVLPVLVCALVASPALATPMLSFVDNMDSSVTLQIILDANGSVATEIAAEGDLVFTGASIVDTAAFDTPNPGNNPFTGGETIGLWLDNLALGQLFVSYGSDVLSPGTFDFLRIEYEGAGTITATGNVAQLGVNNPGLTTSTDVIPEPTSAALLAVLLFGATAIKKTR